MNKIKEHEYIVELKSGEKEYIQATMYDEALKQAVTRWGREVANVEENF